MFLEVARGLKKMWTIHWVPAVDIPFHTENSMASFGFMPKSKHGRILVRYLEKLQASFYVHMTSS